MQQRHQHILSRLPKEWKIIFVEPSLIGAILQRGSLPSSSYSIKENIHITSMPIVHKMDRNSLFRQINDHIIIAWSKLLLRIYHIKHPIILFYEPRFSPVIGNLAESLIWYELIDDRLAFSEVPKWMKGNIETILNKADFVTASSKKLYELANYKRREEGAENTNVFLVGNGVDYDHFANVSNRINKNILSKEIRNLKINQPVVGYFGSVGEWFDFELIEKIGNKFPGVFIVIIGFVFPKQSQQAHLLERQYENIKFLGKKDYSTLPSYLNAFTVAIIPFKIYSLTESVNPTKFYEYCVTGKPIISTALPELQKYQNIIFYAHNHEEFLESLAGIIISKINKKQDENRLRNIARQNSWDEKVEMIMNILLKFIGGKSTGGAVA